MVDIEAFWEGLDQHVIELLEVNEACMHAPTFRAQCGIACDILREFHSRFVPFSVIRGISFNDSTFRSLASPRDRFPRSTEWRM
jgi:hypothetical protein